MIRCAVSPVACGTEKRGAGRLDPFLYTLVRRSQRTVRIVMMTQEYSRTEDAAGGEEDEERRRREKGVTSTGKRRG
jgi:hypothetical protein